MTTNHKFLATLQAGTMPPLTSGSGVDIKRVYLSIGHKFNDVRLAGRGQLRLRPCIETTRPTLP